MKVDIEKAKANVSEAKMTAQQALKVLEEVETKEKLIVFLRGHVAQIVKAVGMSLDSNDASNFFDGMGVIDAFLEVYANTNDIPTIAAHMADKRYEYLQGLFAAVEKDIEAYEEKQNAAKN